MAIHTFITLWCFVACVICDGEYEFISSTPVLNVPTAIQSTDQFNPIKVNVQSEAKAFSTGTDVVLDPTSVNDHLQSTGIGSPTMYIDATVRNQLTTTIRNAPSDSNNLNPTPVLERLVTLETGLENPAFNSSSIPPLITTDFIENDVINPTSVILTLGTNPVPIELIRDDEPGLLSPTGIFIEPSKVYSAGESVTGETTRFNQEPNQESSTKSVDSYIPSNSTEEKLAPTLAIASNVTENKVTLQIPGESNSEGENSPHQPSGIRQFFYNLKNKLHRIWDDIASCIN